MASLSAIAKRIEAPPWNAPGTDKAWVLKAMYTQLKFQGGLRKARRVGTR